MRIWPLKWTAKGRKAFQQRENELRYRLSSASATGDFRVKKLKNGSTVMIREINSMLSYPYATEVYMFKPDLSIITKSYRYARENSSSENKIIRETIEKRIFKDNSYTPTKTITKTILK